MKTPENTRPELSADEKRPALPHDSPATYEVPRDVKTTPPRSPGRPVPTPARAIPKTLTEQLDDVRAISEVAAHRAEIGYRAADRAEAASLRTEAAVKELTRKTLDAEGRPGVLYWMASEMAAMRKATAPARSLALTVVTAALTGGFVAFLATCAGK